MKRIGLIGYGELGRQIEHLIGTTSDISFIYFDDVAKINGVENSYPFNSFIEDEFKDFEFLIALGYKHLRRKKEIIEMLVNSKRKLNTYVHSSAIIDSTAKINEGTVIYPNVTIDKNVCIGKGCLLNLSVTISHDSVVGDCCYLSPSVTLSGFVSVGDMVFFGTGVTVANNIKIDSSSIVGIGTVVTKNIAEGQTVIGNPQKTISKLKLK